MKYTTDDIDFKNISPREFENLCYDLLIRYDYQNLIWREGGADNGRDIEASFFFNTMLRNTETKWFFECKLYNSAGVPPKELTSKIAWADAEQPDYLVFFVSSYLTNAARTWIEKIILQKLYNIVIIEGEELKNRLINYSKLVERYFSLDRYDKLLKDIKDYKVKFKIDPSYDFLREVIDHIDIIKLDNNDIGFILFSFYRQYHHFDDRNNYYGDFDETIINPILEYLELTVTNEKLKSFEKYKDDYNELGGTGIFDEMEFLDGPTDILELTKYDFQYYELHLNHNKDQKEWKIGLYLLIIFKNVAFEFFEDKETEIRIIKDFEISKISDVTLNIGGNVIEKYKKYLENFSA